MKKITLFIAALVCGLVLTLNYVYSATIGVEEKIILEKTLAYQMEEVIKKILGDNNIIVLVNIDHRQGMFSKKDRSIRSLQEGKAFVGLETSGKEKESFLPGIPIKSKKSLSQASIAEISTNYIRNIYVTVIIKEAISEDNINKIKEHLSEVFPIDFQRGDIIEVKRFQFKKDPREELLYWKEAVGTHIPWILGIALLTIFLFGPVKNFLANMISTMDVLRIRADTRITSQSVSDPLKPAAGKGAKDEHIEKPLIGLDGKPILERREGKTSSSQMPHYIGKHFQFINEHNIDNLVYILKKESIEDTALILTYLKPELINLVIENFDAEYKAKVLKEMMNKRQYTNNKVKDIEDSIKQKVDYLLGGLENTIFLLNTFDTKTRDKIIKDLEAENPVLAKEVKDTILPFETLFKLPKDIIREVTRVVGIRVIAAVIKIIPDEEGEHILSSVSENAREMIQQEINVTSTTISQNRTLQIKQEIIGIMQDLEKRGVIKIERKGAEVAQVTQTVMHNTGEEVNEEAV